LSISQLSINILALVFHWLLLIAKRHITDTHLQGKCYRLSTVPNSYENFSEICLFVNFSVLFILGTVWPRSVVFGTTVLIPGIYTLSKDTVENALHKKIPRLQTLAEMFEVHIYSELCTILPSSICRNNSVYTTSFDYGRDSLQINRGIHCRVFWWFTTVVFRHSFVVVQSVSHKHKQVALGLPQKKVTCQTYRD